MLRTNPERANLFARSGNRAVLGLPDYRVGCVEEWSSGLRHLAYTQAYDLANRTAGSNPASSAKHCGVIDVEKLASHIEFVKSQIEFQQRQAIRFAQEPRRSRLHIGAVERFKSLLADLELLMNRINENPELLNVRSAVSAPRLGLSWEEIHGLPQELLEELSISESDKTEFIISSLITELGGVASLDRLLVALYRQSGEITKRAALNQRLYRMVQKELICSVPGKKGVYSIHPISEEDADKLI